MKKIIFFIFLFFNAYSLFSATWYVRTTGNDGTGVGTIGNPYLTLNKALSVISAGDIIDVGSGTFSGALNRGQTTSLNVTIQGAGLGTTIFDCGSAARWISVTGAANVTIATLTVQNTSVAGNGSGINFTSTGTLTISTVAFSSCVATGGNSGGAIYITSAKQINFTAT